MTLDLNLNPSQQKEMAKVISDQSAKREVALATRQANREKQEKMSAEERYKLKNQMLDARIALKERMRNILTPEQFLKWETKEEHRRSKMKNRPDRERQTVKYKHKGK